MSCDVIAQTSDWLLLVDWPCACDYQDMKWSTDGGGGGEKGSTTGISFILFMPSTVLADINSSIHYHTKVMFAAICVLFLI